MKSHSNADSDSNPGRPSPEVTVAMPAHNAGRYIREALVSALNQNDIEMEVIVVDDASTDNTSDVVSQIEDARIRLIRNRERRGIGYCHNLVVRESRAPFIIHVDADDVVTDPNAFLRLVNLLTTRPGLGQVHCHLHLMQQDGTVDEKEFKDMRLTQLRTRTPDRNYQHAMIFEGSVMNGLRTYRKSALERTGAFREDLRFGIDYEMGLRILEIYEMSVVPEMMYGTRTHEYNVTRIRFRKIRFLIQRLRLIGQLQKSGQITFVYQWPNARLRILRIELQRLLHKMFGQF